MALTSARTRLGHITRFSRYLLPYWDKEAVLFFCSLNSTLLGLIGPFLVKLTLDYALGRRDLFFFQVLFFVGIANYIFSGLLKSLAGYLGVYLEQKLDFDIRSDVYRHLHKLSLSFFQTRSNGEQIFRLGADIGRIVVFLKSRLFNIAVSLFRLGMLLVISFAIDPLVTAIALLITPAAYLISYYFGKKRQQVNKELLEKGQDIYSNLQQSFSHIKLIKAFGKEKHESKRYLNDFMEKIRLNFKDFKIGFVNQAVAGSLNKTVTALFGYYVGCRVIRGELSLGSMAALTAYLGQLFSQLTSFSAIYQDLLITFVSMDRLLETLDAPIDVPDGACPVEETDLDGPLSFEGVSFGYLKDRPVIKDLSFSAEPGTVVALSGPSGIGKSSVLSLLLRFYDPTGGRILLNGKNLKGFKLDSLREKAGIVLQEPFLLNDTVFDNIAFGKPQASLEEVQEAARLADAHSFIMELPRQYGTKLGENGCYLSEGQKQRISIARALLKKPKILILDEATSSISLDSEERILNNLALTKDERVTFIVSHRASTVRDADQTVAFREGGVTEVSRRPSRHATSHETVTKSASRAPFYMRSS